MSDLLAEAHAARSRGWRVIPLHSVLEDGSCTCGKATCSPGNHGKHPVDAGWQNTPEMSAADVQATWEAGDRNLGIATGAPSGFWVLDVDPDSGGNESAAALQAEHGKLPATVVAQTGSGGWHFYFAMPEDFDVRNRQSSVLGQGIDVRGTGGQVVAPPSISGKGRYRWAVAPEDVAIAAAPDWLLEMLRPAQAKEAVYADRAPDRSGMDERERRRLDRYTENILTREVARLRECTTAAKPGGRGYTGPPWNATTFEVACTLLQLANSPWSGLTEQQVYATVFEHAPRDREFSDGVVNKAFESARLRIGTKARALPEDRTPAPATVPTGIVDPFEDPTGGVWAAGPSTPARAPVNALPHDAPRSWAVRSWDDMGNARRVVDHYGDRLRWIEQAKRWALYEGGRWVMDEGQLGRALIHDMIDALPRTEALEYPEFSDDDTPERGAFEKWVKAQRMSARVSACITEAAGRRELQATINAFDHDPMLLNVGNGVVNLENGELVGHNPSLLLMQQTEVHYNPAARAPRWERFLREVMPNDDMRAYLQRIVGYSLTGKMGERAMFIHHGSGANGKSVFLQVASAFAGLYGQTVPREALMTRSNGSPEHPAAIARMVGKRFLQASETAQGRRLDEEMVKGLTGGEQQSARLMGKDWFDFTPTGKIHLVTNHLPRLTDAESIWSRLHLVGWRVVIPEDQRDPELANKIIAEELSGVLTWAVQGAVAWAASGLQRPAISKLHLADYRNSQDVFGDFIEECLTLDRSSYSALSDLFGAYQAWCQRSGIRNVMQRNDFAQTLADRPGFERHRTSTSRGFLGATVNAYGRPVLTAATMPSPSVPPGPEVPFDPFEDQ